MTPAQIVFAIALGAITALVLVVGLYLFSSAAWAGRWYAGRQAGEGGRRRTPDR